MFVETHSLNFRTKLNLYEKFLFPSLFDLQILISGPWQPLFKASQVVTDDLSHHESQHGLENTVADTTHGHPHAILPAGLFPHSHSGLRQAKKHNHMIHLHLIPHIYVPVLHPVPHPMSYAHSSHGVLPTLPIRTPGGHGIVPSLPLRPPPTPYPYHNSGEHNFFNENGEDVHTAHSDHSLEHHPLEHHTHEHHPVELHANEHHTFEHEPHHHEGVHHDGLPETLHHDLTNHASLNVADNSLESEELGHTVTEGGIAPYPYYPLAPEPEESGHHQYEVHEEPRDHYYPSGSSVKSQQVLAPTLPKETKSKKSKQTDHGQSSKKNPEFQVTVRRLRMLSPPPLGQTNTWLSNMPKLNSKFFPPRASFESVFTSGPLFGPKFIPKIGSPPVKPIALQSVPTKRLAPSLHRFIPGSGVIGKREGKPLKV